MSGENTITAGQSIADATGAQAQDEPAGQAGGEQGRSQDPLGDALAVGQEPKPGQAEGEEPTEEEVIEMLHGMPMADVVEALKSGLIPDELLEHLRFKAKIDGQDEELSLGEHRLERMRLSDYSRNMQALRNERGDFDRSQQAFGNMLEAWKSKEPMQLPRTLEELELMGLPMHDITNLFARRWDERNQLEQGVPEHLRPMYRQLMSDRDDMRKQLQQLQLQQQRGQQRGAAEPDPQQSATRDRIQRMSPAAFKREGLVDGEVNRAAFYTHLGAIWDRKVELTQDVVNSAARATREDLERNMKALGYAKPGATPQATPAARVAPAPGMPQPSQRRAAAQAPRSAAGNGASNVGTLDQIRANWDRGGR